MISQTKFDRIRSHALWPFRQILPIDPSHGLRTEAEQYPRANSGARVDPIRSAHDQVLLRLDEPLHERVHRNPHSPLQVGAEVKPIDAIEKKLRRDTDTNEVVDLLLLVEDEVQSQIQR